MHTFCMGNGHPNNSYSSSETQNFTIGIGFAKALKNKVAFNAS